MDPRVIEDNPRTEQLTPARNHRFVESTPNHHVVSQRGRPRFRICKTVPTTPVTYNRAETPQPERSSVIESAANGPVRRRLSFSVARAPKRPCTDRPTFRICGNKERTQPANAFIRLEGPLEAMLSSNCAAAATACDAFRSLISGAVFNISLLRDSLILDVVNQVDGLYIARPVDSSSGAPVIAVLAPRSLRSDDRISEQFPGQTQSSESNFIIFVPQPWHILSSDRLAHLNIKWVVIPFRISLVEKERVPTLPPSLVLNKTLLEYTTRNVGEGEQSNASRLIEIRIIKTPGNAGRIYHRFSDISSHLTQVSIKVRVIFPIPRAQMVIVQDDCSETAILLLREHSSVVPEVGYSTFVNLTILPVRLSAQSILQLVLANYNKSNLNVALHNALKLDKSYLTLSTNPL